MGGVDNDDKQEKKTAVKPFSQQKIVECGIAYSLGSFLLCFLC